MSSSSVHTSSKKGCPAACHKLHSTVHKLKSSQEERDTMKQELAVLKATMAAVVTSTGGSVDAMNKHSANQEALKSIKEQLATLSRPQSQ